MVNHKFSESLYLSDFDSSLMNTEGSPIIDKKNKLIVGIRLPNVHNANHSISFAFITPISTITSFLGNKSKGGEERKIAN